MKKLIKFLFIFFLFNSLISCTKNYCARCTEMSTGYKADEFCEVESSVDRYINRMEAYDPAYPTQNWDCIKVVD